MPSDKLFLYKRPNGFWYIGFIENGRRRWKSTHKTTKTEALLSLRESKDQPKVQESGVQFSEFVKQFCSLQANNLRRSTVTRIYIPAFRSFEAICGDKPISAYSLKDIEGFKSDRLATCTATTVNIEFRSLRAAFNSAVKWGMLADNPFLQSSRVKVPERLPVHFTKDEFRALLIEVKEPVLKDLYLFAALTGLRQGEILHLGWKNVDLERRLIVVANSEEFITKSGRCRIVPMNDAVFELMSRRSLLKDFSPLVFNLQGRQIAQSYVEHKFKKSVREARLNDALRFHSLRHTFATWLVQSGANIYEVQKLLGHSDIRTTEIYSHLAASELHSAVNKISAALN